jgi:hypothetical protein
MFLAIVAVAVAEYVQIVGVLLVFVLMVGRAATARRLANTIGPPASIRRPRPLRNLDGNYAGVLYRLAVSGPPR